MTIKQLHTPSQPNPNGSVNVVEFDGAAGSWLNEILNVEEGSAFSFPLKDSTTRIVRLRHIPFCSSGFCSWGGTMASRAVCNCTHYPPNRCDWSGEKLLLKLSYPSVTPASEKSLMDHCREQAEGEHVRVLDNLPDIYWKYDIPLSETDTPCFDLKEEFEDDHRTIRLLRGSIQEEIEPFSSLNTASECAQVFYDIVQCHHWVHTYPQILHQDISLGNIMVRAKDGKKYGVLNDWDLAFWLHERDGISTSRFRTGTRLFMPHKQHLRRWRGPYRYRHDLESLFYVILLLTTLFSSPSKRAYNSLDDDEDSGEEDGDEEMMGYERWFTQGDSFLHDKKFKIILVVSWRPHLTHFFCDFSLWLKRFHRCLYDGFTAYSLHIVRQRDPLQQVPPFDNNTLDGHFSYMNFVLIMHRFCEEELETRNSEWQGILQEHRKVEDNEGNNEK
ncbi:hypothetical protein F5051DRAFT_450290 [Lentinula edodes]|nr:hypothetical protein F5051DRAFT_450290 [Lentinula edodes]